MPIFTVWCYVGGKRNDPRRIEAKDALDAAENVCGGPLIEGSKPGTILAEVLAQDKPRPKTTYRAKN